MKTKIKVPQLIKQMGETRPIDAFPVDHYSYSGMALFCTNAFMFKLKYINRETIPTPNGISSVLGRAFHNAAETYWSTSPELDRVKIALERGTEFLNEFPDAMIEYNENIPSKQKALEYFVFGYNAYIMEKGVEKDTVTLGCEIKLRYEIDCQWQGERLKMPIALKGEIDRLIQHSRGISTKDYKFVKSFSDEEKIDAKKMLQAVVYYFLVYMETGKAPYSCIFEEIKRTKNTSGKSLGKPQVQTYEIVYEDNPLYFDFFFRFYNDLTRALNGEQVYIPNIDTFYDNEVGLIAYIHRLDVNEVLASEMQELKVKSITEVLQTKIENAGNMRKLLAAAEKALTPQAGIINYDAMNIEEKIQTKLLEHGMIIRYHDKIEGYSVDLYRYTPSIGLKMNKLLGFVADIEQVVGKTGVRVLAPIPNSTYIGFEVPKEKRTFPGEVPKGEGFNLAIGADIYSNPFFFDITKAPHMLVAGATGSGKSVFLNSIITQLSALPCDLHLFDPKLVELSQFKKFATDYYTKPEDIYLALDGLVDLMNFRYALLDKHGCRNIDEYQAKSSPEKTLNMARKFIVIDEFGDLALSNEESEGQKKSDRINFSKEIMRNVLILAQKARAAGIHLIIATQRPSVDIITGSIKANFPTKVGFRTAKAKDSEVLLDHTGAEKLLGKGDMLFSSDDGEIRLQGYNA